MDRITFPGRDARGFTLLETATVCAILGILAAMAFPRVQGFMRAEETKSSANQIAGMLDEVRSRAIAEATPHLVLVNDPTVDAAGNCGPFAVVVRDSDRNYQVSAGDRQVDVLLSPKACAKVKLYGQDGTSSPYADLKLPNEDLTTRASDMAGGVVGELVGGIVGGLGGSEEEEDDEESSGPGSSGRSGSSGSSARTATVADTIENGTTFPTDDASGRPVLAFSERGIPVDPHNPTRWGSGAGAIYITDGHETVYAAVVEPLGSIKLRKYDSAAGWR